MNNVLAVFDLAQAERTERNMEFLNATETTVQLISLPFEQRLAVDRAMGAVAVYAWSPPL